MEAKRAKQGQRSKCIQKEIKIQIEKDQGNVLLSFEDLETVKEGGMLGAFPDLKTI